MKKFLVFMIALLSGGSVFAQSIPVEMGDKMRSEGKIYVVIATIVIIFIGLAIYLFTIDRRLTKIEKEN